MFWSLANASQMLEVVSTQADNADLEKTLGGYFAGILRCVPDDEACVTF